MTVAIADLAPEHAAGVAAVHREAFPEAFLTHLGPRFLALFYAELATSPAGLGVVALDGGRVVGFAAGTRSSASFFRAFYRRHLLRVALALMRGVLTDPVVRRLVRSRLRHVRFLLPGRRAAPAPGSAVAARLLSIGVVPAARGGGIAEAVADAYRERLRAEGIERVGLSVLKENARARRFYARTGWLVEYETGDAVYLHRPTG